MCLNVLKFTPSQFSWIHVTHLFFLGSLVPKKKVKCLALRLKYGEGKTFMVLILRWAQREVLLYNIPYIKVEGYLYRKYAWYKNFVTNKWGLLEEKVLKCRCLTKLQTLELFNLLICPLHYIMCQNIPFLGLALASQAFLVYRVQTHVATEHKEKFCILSD